MPKIQRKTQKVFCNSADSDQLAVFGSMSTGTPVYSSDVEELQSNEAFDLGWDAATLEDKAPFMEEMNGVQYGLTYQIAYGLQEGVPEYDSATTYYIGSICKVLEDGKPVLYTSLTDNNIGNDPVNDSTNWERLPFGGGGGLEIGDVGFTQMAIDESKGKRRILNGQLIIQDQYVQFTNIIKATQALNPDLFCTESEWQTELTMSANGVCYKYVIDDEAGTIRLPKYPDYFDVNINTAAKTQTVDVYGTGKALGLYDGSNNAGLKTTVGTNTAAMASLYNKNVGTVASGSGLSGDKALGVVKNASTSGLTGSVTVPAVESEKIKGTYFIQVATGAETEDNIINEIELNNPFFLGMSQYFETAPNNSSWLKSEGQWNAKAVYPTVYDWALINANNGIEGFKLVTDTYTDYDYVINTADETFRLPLLNGSEDLPSDRYEDLTLGASGTSYTAPANGWYFLGKVALEANEYASVYVNGVWGVNQAAPKGNSNISINQYCHRNDNVIFNYGLTGATSYFRFIYAQGNGSLYFYVGETVQNANLVNVGRIQETYTTKSMVDGRWIPAAQNVLQNVGLAIGDEKTIDLSGYLPSDGHNYEVIIVAWVRTGATSGYEADLNIYNELLPELRWITAITRASSNNQASGIITLPVGQERNFTLKSVANYPFDIISLGLRSYRRIGTNL